MKFGSLFCGVGGFDLGFEQAGLKCFWQVEHNKQCLDLLHEKWPDVAKWTDVKSFAQICNEAHAVDLICGGDPCPKHGNARRGQPSAHPDLSGYFLAVAGRLRPRWVVRENVPSPTVDEFATALAALGYGTIIVGVNASSFVPQNRIRSFVIGRFGTDWRMLRKMFPQSCHVRKPSQKGFAMAEVSSTLVSRWSTNNADQTYVLEVGRARVFDGSERASIAGFPRDWAARFSLNCQARMYGNSVCPPVAKFLAAAILEYERNHA